MESSSRSNKISGFELISIISSIGIIGLIISDFFGGMILYLVAFGLLLIPLIIFYLISLIETIIAIRKKGKKTSKIKLVSHGLVIIVLIIFNLYNSELFKSNIIMSAILKDDLYNYRLVFRENGTVENKINGFMGYTEIQFGKYSIHEDKIVFSKKPYVNDFIPDTLLIDREQNAIFLNRNKNGEFSTEKTWLNHFEIE